MKPTPAQLDEFFTRRVEKVIGERELREKLLSGKKLTVKHGVDVTAPFLHLGHAVNYWMMRDLQEWGHKVVFLIGGFTTRIGDPTGKSETRPVISEAEIQKNAKEFIKQVSKVLLTDPKVFEVRNNAEWFDKMRADEFVRLLSNFTYAQLIERDMFQKRIKEGREIRMHEMIYPIVQGYDSFALKSDVTIVGNDQLFNEMMGRFYQERFGQDPQAIITTKITPGLDGKEKQSKSLNNYIALEDGAGEMYGKVMSLPDALIMPYFEVYTTVPKTELAELAKELKKGANPRDLKMKLAHTIAELYHGKAKADAAEKSFVHVFQKGSTPTDIQTIKLSKSTPLLDVLLTHKLIASKTEGKRLIEQAGIKINDKAVTDPGLILDSKVPATIQIGKRRFLKLV